MLTLAERQLIVALIANLKEVDGHREQLRSARYGLIEFSQSGLQRIQLRAWPKFSSLLEAWWSRRFGAHHRSEKGGCRLFYNEPRSCPGFLSLPYLESDRNASMSTVLGALAVLDEIAYLKSVRAIVCEVANDRISDRLLQRQGWERHLPNHRRRHYIKRFAAQTSGFDELKTNGLIAPEQLALSSHSLVQRPSVEIDSSCKDCESVSS